MVKLRTTINPTVEINVSPSESADLHSMGAVLDMTKTRATTDEGLIAAAVRQVTGAAEADDSDNDQTGDAAGDNTQEG